VSHAGSALPFIVPTLQLRPGAVLLYYPDHTKSGKADGPMHVQLRPDLLDSTTWLNKLVMESLAQGHPITNFIARPLGANRTYFLENGITPSELAARAKDRFTDALPGGQIRLHGARRGSIQHARFVEGKPRHLVQEHAQIRCEHIMQVYENPEGHSPPALERFACAKKIRLS